MFDSVRPHRQQPTSLPRPWDSPGKNTGVGCHFLLQCMKVKSETEVTQSCLTLSDSMDCSPPGFSVRGSLQARILEWVAISFSRGSSRSRDQTQVSLIAHTVKNPPTMQETPVRFLGQEDSPGGGNGNPLQYSCLETPIDRGAWWGMVLGVTKSPT